MDKRLARNKRRIAPPPPPFILPNPFWDLGPCQYLFGDNSTFNKFNVTETKTKLECTTTRMHFWWSLCMYLVFTRMTR